MTEGQMQVGADAMHGFFQAVFERAGVPWPFSTAVLASRNREHRGMTTPQ